MSSNWLATIKRGYGSENALDLRGEDARQMIVEGADMIIKQMRTDLMPRFHYEVPYGVTVVTDETKLENFFIGIVALAVRQSKWSMQRFAYPAKKITQITATAAWQSFATGLGRHDCHPILLIERDVYCFNGGDWHIGQIKIGLGLE